MSEEYEYEDEYEEPDVVELREKLKTVKERVEYIMTKYPQTRNDDLYLWLIYVRLFEPELSKYIRYIPYRVLQKAIKPTTIKRIRAKIQNEEKRLLPTDPKVLRKRRIYSETWRKAIVKV